MLEEKKEATDDKMIVHKTLWIISIRKNVYTFIFQRRKKMEIKLVQRRWKTDKKIQQKSWNCIKIKR